MEEIPLVARGSAPEPAAAQSGKARVLTWILVLVAAAAIGFALWLRSHRSAEPQQAGIEKPVRDVPYLDGAAIRYSAGFAERNKLEFAVADSGMLSPVVHVTGTVAFDPDKVAAIGARIAGRVRKVYKLEGDPVKPGDVLAEIESAELGEAQAALISARAHADAAGANERRERELAAAKISSNRDAELAAAAAASARADLLAAEGRVRAMAGGRTSSEPGILLLHSPIQGKVVERNLWRGQFVEPTLMAFKVANLSRVFVELAVFERDVVTIRAGDAVEFSVPGAQKSQVEGRVSYVGDEIDMQSKTAIVRVIVEQPATPLRPGQSVLAKIHTAERAEPTLVLPRDAVTSVDGKTTVFVAHDETSVEPRAVTLGRQDGHRVEIIDGLTRGERVVVNGVFALKSEIFR
jgi:cobalt-zinc-cadmium efflux system membrane fusion protein